MTSKMDLFMALHMIWVRIRPLAPTSDPAMMRSGLSSTKPVVEAATPEKALRSAMTTGMSAPPMATVLMTPRMRPAATSAHSHALVSGCRATMTTNRSATTITIARARGKPVKPDHSSDSCSLKKAMTEPVKVTAPMSAVAAAAMASWLSALPSSMASMKEATATRTDAPPPKPLKSATNSGMDVILTLTANRAPTTEPITSATARAR